MQVKKPTVQLMEILEAQRSFALLVHQVAQDNTRVLVEEAGEPVAAIISAEALARYDQYEASREEQFAVIDRLRAAFADVSTEEIERESDRVIAEIRGKAFAADSDD